MKNKIWTIEWSIKYHCFIIARYADGAVATSSLSIDQAIKDINGNYPEWEVILIRDQAGCVSYKLNDENPEIVTFVDNLRRLLS